MNTFRRTLRQFNAVARPIKSRLKGIVHPSPFSAHQAAKYKINYTPFEAANQVKNACLEESGGHFKISSHPDRPVK
jgi:hypothetical protein